jgi:hypothetical protein
MSIKDWASINGHQYYNMIFIKDIKMIYLNYYLSSAQAGSLCHQIPWDRLAESQGKETFARGSFGIRYNWWVGRPHKINSRQGEGFPDP